MKMSKKILITTFILIFAIIAGTYFYITPRYFVDSTSNELMVYYKFNTYFSSGTIDLDNLPDEARQIGKLNGNSAYIYDDIIYAKQFDGAYVRYYNTDIVK